ncbi:unnamed protein product [Ceutorhynchus assimilis]|uniref:Uncharacterized protein n=1 Tax=Ceutorhynchus assimilis TaxID=467358 RepID=A0A9N9MLZ3_9CUCU|nr:unnamed protein product [Ceutorhynchus assimilis]
MRRNSSDIFCLKEPQAGDTRGTQMFSVNGQCQLSKVGRRRHLHSGSSSFEYGSHSPPPGDSAQVLQEPLMEEVEGIDALELHSDLHEAHLDSPRSDMAVGTLSSSACSPSTYTSAASSPNKFKRPAKTEFRKINSQKEEEKILPSVMSRNPLTGAGLETETRRNTKKGATRQQKWTW